MRYAHHPVVVRAYVDRVVLCHKGEVVAEHRRRWGREGVSFDPVHYLALLERKPGALDHARPLEGWELPECFAVLRRRLEAERDGEGTREFIRVLRLLEKHPLDRLTAAVEQGLRVRAHTPGRDRPVPAAPRGLAGDDVLARRPRAPAPRRGAGHRGGGVPRPAADRGCAMTTTQPAVLLEHYLKQLKLPTILREYARLAAVCTQDRSDYATYLLRLAEREVIEREHRAAERRVKAAGFPVLKTLDTFDFAAQPSINEALVRELIGGAYIENRENVLVVGNSGTGKTHLACALAFAACAQGRRVRFFTVTGLVTQLLEKREERSLEKMQRQLERMDLLVLDELGYVPFSKSGGEVLFEVVSRAYERTSLIVTTNLPFESWPEVLGSERLTGALLDRLTHRVQIIEANGESYRLRESKRRQRRASPRDARGS